MKERIKYNNVIIQRDQNISLKYYWPELYSRWLTYFGLFQNCNFKIFLYKSFNLMLLGLMLMLISARVERFSVSHMQDLLAKVTFLKRVKKNVVIFCPPPPLNLKLSFIQNWHLANGVILNPYIATILIFNFPYK